MTEAIGAVIAFAALVFTGVQIQLARIADRESKARLAIEDRQVVLSIHGDLTTREVQAAKDAAADSPADRRFLTALHSRCAARYDLVVTDGKAANYLADDIRRELDGIEALDPTGTQRAAEELATKGGGSDRSRFVWDGRDTVTKHHTLQRIAQRFKDTNRIGDAEEFRERFAAELESAVSARPFKADGMLVEVSRADAAHRAVADSASGALVLDGVEYVVNHSLGFPRANYGTQVQIPVIAHFRSKGYPITDP